MAWINLTWKVCSFSVVPFTHIQASNNRFWVLQKETPQKQFHYFRPECESMIILNPYSIDTSVTAADGSTLLIKQAWLIVLMLLFCYRPSFCPDMHQKLKPGLPGNGDFLQQAHHYIYILITSEQRALGIYWICLFTSHLLWIPNFPWS